MFLGTHQLRLDDKGRLVLPAKFRPELENGVVVTRGQEHCLVLFSQGEFATVHEKASRAPITNKGARDYLRVFMSAASAEVPDKQWRITIPQILRRYAGLGRDVAVIGVGNRAEIWDVEAWEAYLAQTEGEFADREDEVIDGIL